MLRTLNYNSKFIPGCRKLFLRGFTTTIASQSTKVSLTLFAKEGCSLCDKAKDVLQLVRQNKNITNPIDFKYVDITDPLNNEWWDAYCFDVPVLHVDRFNQKDPIKFMHRLNEDKVVEEINRATNELK